MQPRDPYSLVRTTAGRISCALSELIRIVIRRTEAEGVEVLEEKSVLILPKAMKTQAEIDGYYACHLRDGSALTAFFCWLEHHVVELEETYVSVLLPLCLSWIVVCAKSTKRCLELMVSHQIVVLVCTLGTTLSGQS